MRKLTLTAVLFISVFIFNTAIYSANTVINDNTAGEASLVNNTVSGGTSILNHLYGAGNYTRVSDSLDQIWSINNGNTNAVARFAGNASTFGYYTGTSGLTNGLTFNSLFNITGSGYSVLGSATNLSLNNFRWGLSSGGSFFSSQPIDNLLSAPPGQDMMVTFQITGNSGGFGSNSIGNYVVAWEDTGTAGADRDFNDAVIELSNAVPAPEPATFLVMGTFLTMIYAARRKSLKSA